ncbi:ATP-binding protein [Embleya sp. NPDC005575]|uniref:ATP-binding protein n=1 Tax=Embleya sp. NPDC005575 TaxID=3156892 RepID=UPI0033A9AD2B
MTSAPAPHLHLPRDTVVTTAARAYVFDVCTALGVDRTTEGHADWLDDVLVVASELVTNAWRHTTGEIAVYWWVDGHTLTFAVTDTRFVELVWPRDSDAVSADGEGGRGLGIVANLAHHLAYGPICHDGHHGKWVAAGFTLPEIPHAVQHRRQATKNRPMWQRDRCGIESFDPEGHQGSVESRRYSCGSRWGDPVGDPISCGTHRGGDGGQRGRRDVPWPYRSVGPSRT